MWVAAAVVAWMPGPAAAENPNDILVVVNREAPSNQVSGDEVKSMFMKLKTRWRGGAKIVPVHAKPGSPLRRDFLRRILGMNPSEEEAYWNDRKIRAGVSKPLEFTTPLKAVFNINGAVGYVYRSQFKKGLAKVILVIPAN